MSGSVCERERGEIDGYIYIYRERERERRDRWIYIVTYMYIEREILYPQTLNSKARTLEFRVQGLGIRVCSFRV